MRFSLRTLLLVSTLVCLYLCAYSFLLDTDNVERSISLRDETTVVVRKQRVLRYKNADAFCSKVFAPIQYLDQWVRTEFWAGEESEMKFVPSGQSSRRDAYFPLHRDSDSMDGFH